MKTDDTLLMSWQTHCFLCSPDTWMACDNTQFLSLCDCLTELSNVNVCDVMVLTSVDSLRKYEYDNYLAIFYVLAIFLFCTLLFIWASRFKVLACKLFFGGYEYASKFLDISVIIGSRTLSSSTATFSAVRRVCIRPILVFYFIFTYQNSPG
jgi:hypothetical protein